MAMDKVQIFKNLKDAPRGLAEVDCFQNLVTELFFILHPNFKKDTLAAKKHLEKFISSNAAGEVWIHYTWTNKIFRCVPEDMYFRLRTARNRNVITEEEQLKYRNITVGIAGLSVGSKILEALVQSGGPKYVKIADLDTIELSNLNRIHATFLEIGKNKAEVAAKHVWEIDPFAQIKIWKEGIAKETIVDFMLGDPKLDVFVDEMDDLKLKILSRTICKREGIPVIMATDNGDSVILDIERFDFEKERPIFHGTLEGENFETSEIDFPTRLKLLTKIVQPKYLTERVQESLLEIGKTIGGIPQLGTTAALAGSAVSFAIRRIANKQTLPSGRYVISLEEKLVPNYNDTKMKRARAEKIQEFIDKLKSKQ